MHFKTLVLILLLVGTGFGVWRLFSPENAPLPRAEFSPVERDVTEPVSVTPTEETPPAAPPLIEMVEPKLWPAVPFTSQAPLGEWSQSAFQDGCEEASALMAYLWRSGKRLTPGEAERQLLAMARFQEGIIGHGVDTDPEDTKTLLLDRYFGIGDAVVRSDFTLEELRRATGEGLVIVPTNGRALGNPNFTPPGPLQHMLVVTGYDALTKEFVTNDPGTRRGEGYRYAENILYAAIREYPSGEHAPIVSERKTMIIIPPGESLASPAVPGVE
jgi:hypothetical protein